MTLFFPGVHVCVCLWVDGVCMRVLALSECSEEGDGALLLFAAGN